MMWTLTEAAAVVGGYIEGADVRFDSDDLSSLALGEMRGRVLHSLSDLDGDGKRDLLVGQFLGSTPRTVFEANVRFYRNVGTGAQTRFDGFAYLKAGKRLASVPSG